MPNNTFSAEEIQTILNCNKLLHLWHPALSKHITWQQNDGSIEVFEDEHSAFDEDLTTLLIHCRKFQNLVAKRLQNLPEITALNLPQLYKKAQILHGMHFLLRHYHDNIYTKAAYCATKITESTITDNETPLINLVESLLEELLKSKNQISQLQEKQQALLNKIYVTTFPLTTGLNAMNGNISAVIFTPRQLEISHFTHKDQLVSIRAHLTADNNAFLQPTTPWFADLTTFQFYQQNKAVPVLLLAYPRWPTETNISAMTITQFQACPDGARERLAHFSANSTIGILPYQQPLLATTLCGPFAEPEQQSLLSHYFQAMVEIAKAHHCYQVVCFIPFDFTLIAHAMGFYSDNVAEKTRCQDMLAQALANKQALELLDDSENQFEGNEELCHPVYFPLSEIATRKVHLEGLEHVTTYAEAIDKMSLFHRNPEEGIIPDPYGFMTKPICSFFNAIKRRQITGRAVPTLGKTYLSEKVDYIWLTDNQTLLGIGESSHLPSTDRKMMTRILK